MEKDDIVKVFTGSDIEAGFISELLKGNGIECLTRNLLNEGLVAGWVSAMQGNGSAVYVSVSDKETALEIINNCPKDE